MDKTSKQAGEDMADEMMKKLGFELDENGKLREITGGQGRREPLNSHTSPQTPVTPFRIPVIEKTTRQAASTQGYKASAHWQTASLLHDLINLWTPSLPSLHYQEARKREQVESAVWGTVSTIEEGWARPSTKEYLDFLGFSQASLAEVRGGIERFGTKGYLKTGNYGNLRENKGVEGTQREKGFSAMREAGIPVPSRNFPYPPVNSRRNPSEYGKLRERLREYTGREMKAENLTLEIFTELINKTDYLISRAVFGLQEKVIREEKEKFEGKVRSSWKPWKK